MPIHTTLKCECGLLACRTCYARLRARASRASLPRPSNKKFLCQCGKCRKQRDYRRRRAAGEMMFVGRPAGRSFCAIRANNTFLKWAATRPAEWRRQTEEVLNRCQ